MNIINISKQSPRFSFKAGKLPVNHSEKMVQRAGIS